MLANIKYLNLETYRNHLRDKITKNKTIRSDASVNGEMSSLHHIFTKTVEWEMIEQKTFDGLYYLEVLEDDINEVERDIISSIKP